MMKRTNELYDDLVTEYTVPLYRNVCVQINRFPDTHNRPRNGCVIVWVNAQRQIHFCYHQGATVLLLHGICFLANTATIWLRMRVCVIIRCVRWYLYVLNELVMSTWTSNSTDSLYQIICWIDTPKCR